MMLALAAPMFLTVACDRPRPASLEGKELMESISRTSAHIRESWTYGELWKATTADLVDLWHECSQLGWDGYNAPALTPAVIRMALRFVESIPFDIPAPEISASAAGEVTFEWAQTSRRIVSVAVSGNGEIYFASLNGNKRNFGSMPFDGTFDRQLHQLIQTVLG